MSAGLAAQRVAPTVRFVDLERQEAPIAGELMATVKDVVRRRDFILGEGLQRFEAQFAAYLGVRHVIGVGSGGSALALALKAVGVTSDDEVLVPANSYVASAFAAMYLGARPVLVDADPQTFQMNPARLEAAITRRSKAVMAVHLYGYAAPLDEIRRIANRHELPVVEDAAQAHGTTYGGRRCGSLGLASGFSFYPSKNLGAWGDGGAIATDDESVAQRILAWRSYGDQPKNVHLALGVNSRLDTLQAAVLGVKLRVLDEWNEQRRQAAAWYRKAFHALGVDRYVELPPFAPPEQQPNWHLFVIRVRDGARDALRSHLEARGIECGIHYPRPIHLQPIMASLGYHLGQFQVAERLAAEVLSLPMFSGLEEHECSRVAEEIGTFFRQRR